MKEKTGQKEGNGEVDNGTDITNTAENGSLRQCSLVSSNMAGGRLFPVLLAPDPKGL